MEEFGPLGEVLPDVRRIAVLRGGGIGDMVSTLPAIGSLSDAYPDAGIVLLGTEAHEELFRDRPGPVSEVRVLPVAKGVYEPSDTPADPVAEERFFSWARQSRFDLAVQLHGGGRWSNPFVRRLGARCTVGSHTDGVERLDRSIPYQLYQHEVFRTLEVVGQAGAAPTRRLPALDVTETDLAAADAALEGLEPPVLAVHPGARDPRRRWPTSRFGEVVGEAVSAGASAVVLGSPGDGELADEVVRAARGRRSAIRSLAGRLALSGVLGVLSRSAVLLANDSGPRHLAQAVGTPTVSVFWIGNVITAAPFVRARHRVHVSTTVACPVCGADCSGLDAPRCPHDVSFLTDVRVGPVRDDVLELIGTTDA
ncbi:hypothetical protein ALI22I_14285 [Saccharothrix sp. ALI-22-I]|uniref:glycosyltransferase family 9 protein n=1 Tax=Saccharothrix sp. ALI-22-I TaxID=1933778 RepID=UPI00097C21D2|nr:glycosyltransferase family 9 protein [Saccharothrix sp. ALI-22-I]ONI89668.1 hypothetical protein ALI22I_14285 [Saccharothrix sp. ALI-22-I]